MGILKELTSMGYAQLSAGKNTLATQLLLRSQSDRLGKAAGLKVWVNGIR